MTEISSSRIIGTAIANDLQLTKHREGEGRCKWVCGFDFGFFCGLVEFSI